MRDNTRIRSILLAGLVVLWTIAGGIALTGTVTAADNLHDGSMTDSSTGERIYAANSTEKKSITYGYSVDNVTNTGESVKLYLEFPDEVNNSAGKLSSFGGNVTCKCGGNPESIGVESSATIGDGMDGDGVKETIVIGVQPNKKDKPIDIIVNFTGDATWPKAETNEEYDLKAGVDEPNKNIEPTEKFEDITIAGGLYTETDSASNVDSNAATLSGSLWNLNGTSDTDVWFAYWEKGKKDTTKETTRTTSMSSTGSFSDKVTGLSDGTTYVFRAATYNGKEYDNGPEVQFTTTASLNVDTKSASSVQTDSATLNGNLTSLGDSSSTDVWFAYWEKGKKDTTKKTTSTTSMSSTGTFSDSVSGLKSGTTYVFRAATQDGSTYDSGSEQEFTTS